jgi:hypothetical protein
LILGKKKEQND